jgi:hypothetical protein
MQDLQEQAAASASSRAIEEVMMMRAEVSGMLAEAQRIRQEALADVEVNTRYTRRFKVEASLLWHLVDLAQGNIIARGSTEASAMEEEKDLPKTGFSSSVGFVSASRRDIAIRNAVGQSLRKVAEAISERIGDVPFRAKVGRADGREVIINAGSNLGVVVGDTFGIRPSREVLTDPDTGLPLETLPLPIGRIMVVSVLEKVSIAQTVQRSPSVKRGDELEWVGFFQIVENPGSPQERVPD